MNRRMKWLVAAAAVLLVVNMIKWIMPRGDGKDSGRGTLAGVSINYQRPGGPDDAQAVRNLFNGPTADYRPEAARMAPAKPGIPAATLTPAIKWPELKISGTAISDGKKCAFFSGRALKGAVYEGGDILDRFRLSSVQDNSIEITDKISGETKSYALEGR